MYVALVELDVFSGVSVFQPYASTSAPTYPLPPPTTLVGALAYPYMRRFHVEDVENHSAAVKLLNHIVYATSGSKGYVVTRDVERVYQAIYQRKDRWREEFKELWYSIAVRGLVKYIDDELYVVYVSRNREILDYAHGITRIGRKESHAVVKSVSIWPLKDVIARSRRGESFETIFCTPASIASCAEATAVKIRMHRLTPSSFTHSSELETEEFYIPRGWSPMKCELLDNGALIKLKNLTVAIPKQFVG